jgi:hypothetical protein
VEVTKRIVARVLGVVDAGLVAGWGVPVPGRMCAEAATCFALNLQNQDAPFGEAVRAYKYLVNDSDWSSRRARAMGMRRLAVADLGSDEVDQAEFSRRLAKEVIVQIVPLALRATAGRLSRDNSHRRPLLAVAAGCEGQDVSYRLPQNVYAVLHGVGDDIIKAGETAVCAAYAVSRSSSLYAGYSVRSASFSVDAADVDGCLSLAAELAVRVLSDLGSPGARFLKEVA